VTTAAVAVQDRTPAPVRRQAPGTELAAPEHRGSTDIADRVVEKIASGAVAEVDDAYGSARRLLGLRMPGATAPRVTVQIDGHLATVRVAMSVRYPAPIRQVTREVREHVMERVGELTGLDVRHVDIEIPALITPDRGRRVR
jgi:uncharacterized alkaline shock family protein YloU